jgi:hypothetical protein
MRTSLRAQAEICRLRNSDHQANVNPIAKTTQPALTARRSIVFVRYQPIQTYNTPCEPVFGGV